MSEPWCCYYNASPNYCLHQCYHCFYYIITVIFNLKHQQRAFNETRHVRLEDSLWWITTMMNNNSNSSVTVNQQFQWVRSEGHSFHSTAQICSTVAPLWLRVHEDVSGCSSVPTLTLWHAKLWIVSKMSSFLFILRCILHFSQACSFLAGFGSLWHLMRWFLLHYSVTLSLLW